MRKSRRLVSIILAIAMIFVLAAPAFASSTYSQVSANFATSNSNAAPLGTAKIAIPTAEMTAGDSVNIKLPQDFSFFPNTETYPAGVTVAYPDFATAAIVDAQAPATHYVEFNSPNVSNSLFSAAANNFTVAFVSEREVKLTLTNAALTAGCENGYIYVKLLNVFVPSSASGDVSISFDAQPGTSFASGSVVVGKVGSGSVELSIDDVNTITSTGGNISTVNVKEDRPGALRNSTKSIKVKLPSGFEWNTASAVTTTNKWGTIGAQPAGANLTAALTAAGTGYTLTDNNRTLQINSAGGSVAALYYTITGLGITVDESVAKAGDIEAIVSGDSSTTPSTLVIGRYGDFSSSVSTSDAKDVRAGRTDEEIGKIIIDEAIAGSLIATRTVTLTLTGGAKWHQSPIGTLNTNLRIDTASSDQRGLTLGAWAVVGDSFETIKATVTTASTGSKPAKIVLEKGNVDLSADATGEIKVVVAGTAGASGEGLVANVVKPVTVAADGALPDLIIGEQNQAVADVIVTENMKEAIDATGANNVLAIEFPAGVTPGLPKSVEVIEGDLQLDKSSPNIGYVNDKFRINVNVLSTSSTPSKVKFSGITVTTDRTVPTGGIAVKVKGTAVDQTAIAGLFPGSTTAAKTNVANCITASPKQETGANVKFKIGENKYTANGVEKTMDVAPYIKDNRTFVPVRYVAYALGVNEDNVLWDNDTQKVTILKGDKVVQMTIGSKELLVNGAVITMDVAPEITNDRTMLPFRFIAQALGAKVTWDEATQTVTIVI
ncbi:MAG: hypothetical protein A4E53_00048 [Pelotomaculum sp. PtaB.Bin104]|nr:MAG: hypothetical protein A4E53_00048 [Pelotomaculum sp. PtaB.Bin104]